MFTLNFLEIALFLAGIILFVVFAFDNKENGKTSMYRLVQGILWLVIYSVCAPILLHYLITNDPTWEIWGNISGYGIIFALLISLIMCIARACRK